MSCDGGFRLDKAQVGHHIELRMGETSDDRFLFLKSDVVLCHSERVYE